MQNRSLTQYDLVPRLLVDGGWRWPAGPLLPHAPWIGHASPAVCAYVLAAALHGGGGHAAVCGAHYQLGHLAFCCVVTATGATMIPITTYPQETCIHSLV